MENEVIGDDDDRCRCEEKESFEIPARKKEALTVASRTHQYLRDRRIPDLVNFLITKLLSAGDPKPVEYINKLLDDCMLFRAGHGKPPVLYEERHLREIVKSFDPGNRGWLSAGQVRRAYVTVGLCPPDNIEEKTSTEALLQNLIMTQEIELYELLTAGMDEDILSDT